MQEGAARGNSPFSEEMGGCSSSVAALRSSCCATVVSVYITNSYGLVHTTARKNVSRLADQVRTRHSPDVDWRTERHSFAAIGPGTGSRPEPSTGRSGGAVRTAEPLRAAEFCDERWSQAGKTARVGCSSHYNSVQGREVEGRTSETSGSKGAADGCPRSIAESWGSGEHARRLQVPTATTHGAANDRKIMMKEACDET